MIMQTILAQSGGGLWMPDKASTYADQVDWLFHFILGISSFFFVLIVVLMIVFLIRYRQRPGHREQKTASHSTALELTWTIIPLILVIIIFAMGFKGYMNMAVVPANAYEIVVTAYKWNWAFTYPNGHVDENLHVPVNQPVKLVLTSKDVIHSLYIPAFRIKKDAVPGRYNTLWFEATQVNTSPGFDLFCAEYCGTSHSEMLAKVFVHEPNDFAKWLETASNWVGRIVPAERGAQLFKGRGCNQCHSIDGTHVIGPTFKDLWDQVSTGNVVFKDGTRLKDILNDRYSPEDYLRESIVDPEKRIVAGYTQVAMQSFRGSFKDNDIDAMIAYIKTLSKNDKPEPTMPASEPAEHAASTPAPR